MATSFTTVSNPPTPAEDLTSLFRYARRIQGWTTGYSFSDYQLDTKLSDAVERNFIEIGNIMHRFERVAPDLYHQVPNSDLWYAFRIKLDHTRWTIDQTIVWDTIQTNLPVLIQATSRLLQEYPENTENAR